MTLISLSLPIYTISLTLNHSLTQLVEAFIHMFLQHHESLHLYHGCDSSGNRTPNLLRYSFNGLPVELDMTIQY